MNEKNISPMELVERAYRHSGKSEYDPLPLSEVIKMILQAITDEID